MNDKDIVHELRTSEVLSPHFVAMCRLAYMRGDAEMYDEPLDGPKTDSPQVGGGGVSA